MSRKPDPKFTELEPYTAELVAEAVHVALMRASHTGTSIGEQRRCFLRHVSTAVLEALAGDRELGLTRNDLILVLLGTALAAQLGMEDDNDGK